MTYTLRFLPEVEDDVVAGYARYEDKAPGLGQDWAAAVFGCLRDWLLPAAEGQ